MTETASTMSLPSHPHVRSIDPLGVWNSTDYDVPLWDVLSVLLLKQHPRNIHDLLDLLTDIAASIGRADSAGDYNMLVQCLEHSQTAHSFFSRGLPALLDIALQLPVLFPSHTLTTLRPDTYAVLALNRRQVYCLLAHMFLGTLQAPPWQQWWVDFGVWLHSSGSSCSNRNNQAGPTLSSHHSCEASEVSTTAAVAEGSVPHLASPAAVYLHMLLSYFNQLATPQSTTCDRFWTKS